MSILVFAESNDGKCKRAAFEAVTFGSKWAALLDSACIAVTIGSPANGADLGIYGAQRVLDITTSYTHFDGMTYGDTIVDLARQLDASTVVVSHTSRGKALAGYVAARLDAGLASGVKVLPFRQNEAILVKKPVYSGKAIATLQLSEGVNVVSVLGNSIPVEAVGQPVAVEQAGTLAASSLSVAASETQGGRIPLHEASLVVSGGRGFKGPENWGLLEELAETLGAATACSRPVADSGWRPHHEHVGQTGVAISPDLYIAIGISGAIQHLGGVNNSKTIVVINKDPEAPFFKSANYGVVGDLFEVVPRLTEAVKTLKAKG